MKKLYGGETTLESPELREKQRKTMIEKYGGWHPSMNQKILEKLQFTIIYRIVDFQQYL